MSILPDFLETDNRQHSDAWPQIQHRLETEQILELVQAYLKGTRISDLARQYEIDQHTVYAHLRRQGARILP